MEEVVKVGIIGILGILTAIQFKAVKPEYSTYISVALALIIFGYVVQQLKTMLAGLSWIKDLFEGSGGYLAILLKVIGITYLCEFTSGVCKDAGYSSIATQVEIAGRILVLVASVPVLLSVISMIQNYEI